MRLSIILVIAALVFGCSKKNVSFSNIPQESWLEKHVEKKLKKIKVDKKQEIVVETPLYVSSEVLFDFDNDRIRADAMETLDALVLEIEKYPDCLILLVGNTCRIGTDEYNYALGERRAESVQKYILLNLPKLRESQIRIVSYGKGHCTVDKSRFSECRKVVYTVSE